MENEFKAFYGTDERNTVPISNIGTKNNFEFEEKQHLYISRIRIQISGLLHLRVGRAQCSAKGAYFVDCLNRKWMREELHDAVDVLKGERWDFSSVAHCTKIQFANALQW
jgi:hypothetical protein